MGTAPDGPDPYIDLYWAQAGRWPYLIVDGAAPVGLVLVNDWSPSGQGTDYSVAEFYVVPASRGRGIGRKAANLAFVLHAGVWEAAVVKANFAAVAFWSRIITAAVPTAAITDAGDRWIWRFASPLPAIAEGPRQAP